MRIHLSNASDKPIYEQITVQLKEAILANKLHAGDALPSIRALAKDLKISVMTTKRAYADLERDGFIETVAGKGSFVTERNQDFLREELLRQVEEHLQKAVRIAKTAGLVKEELVDLLSLIVEEDN
ncbi:GntR family transcriptional regulator [Lysinibacillus sphaericus]|uniref:GntR family transcriptional regulator n=3 Tax=Lysinibacillus TaxID=400634 RepID=A0A2S0K3L3_LYSSH|nr:MULTISPECIES: GntR family transcriptional regulator [Lysinibacillus]AVK97960.1 GntR family transcriptional regulator [Lysinibacillus sphaericus]MCS1380893.1 GntR family transcriptional regulator [Lysinibacillus sphaericus]MED4543460.1 GntR family transcriptional regulator [Lysinibacillus sphaericus]TKI18955.1 GntR family transcriptional regulator [Lysinibacillus sphaericus]TKI48346.1 GntR family transcriptional regulator [Lysinibacillus tabacifolii]